MYDTNPYLDQMVQRAQDSVKSNINTAAINSGSFGNSGVQEMMQRGLGDVATQMYGQDYNNAMNRGVQYNLGMGNLQLGHRNTDLNQAALGANLFQQGNTGFMNQGQGIYNLGLTGQQAPWQTMQNFNSAASPYTGFGSTTQQQNGSAGAGFLGGAMGAAQMYNIFK